MSKYIAKLPWGERLEISADLAQASAPVSFLDPDGEWASTPFQTADARHDADEAVRLILSWFGRDYYAASDDDRDSDDILRDVMQETVVTRIEDEDE